MTLELKPKTKRLQKNLSLSENACELIDRVAKLHRSTPSSVVEQMVEHYFPKILGDKNAKT